MNDQAAQLRKRVYQNETKTRIIAIASGKGGVGKSNISVNLGIALQEIGKKVLLLDADLGMANLDILLGLTSNNNLSHVLKGKCKFEDAVLEGPGEIDILPGTTGVDDLINISSTEIRRLIEASSHMEHNYDIILLDIGAGLHYSVTNFILACQEAVIVLTPEPTAIMDAYSLIKYLSNKNYQGKIKILINQITSSKEGKDVSNRMQKVIKQYLQQEIELLGLIPFDESVRSSVKKQVPFLILYPGSEAAGSIKKIAAKMIDKDDEEIESPGMKGFIYKIVGIFNRN